MRNLSFCLFVFAVICSACGEDSSGARRWAVHTELTPVDMTMGSFYGNSVAVDGNTLVVGAPFDNTDGDGSGAIYIYSYENENWNLVKKLTPLDGKPHVGFGGSVDINGDTIIVGTGSAGADIGSAYIFERNAGGENNWGQVWILSFETDNQNGTAESTVAIHGTTAVVGYPGDMTNTVGLGAAYVIEKVGDDWTETAKLLPADSHEHIHFGISVDLSENVVIVGAGDMWDSGDEGEYGIGAAYVFERVGTGEDAWVEGGKLVPPDGVDQSEVDFDVAIDGHRAALGCPHHDHDGNYTGAVYVYERVNDSWHYTQELIPSDSAVSGEFGHSLEMNGGEMVVGARYAATDIPEAGAAYVFNYQNDEWQETQKLVSSNPVEGQGFGESVSVSGDWLVVGSLGWAQADAAYVFGAD